MSDSLIAMRWYKLRATKMFPISHLTLKSRGALIQDAVCKTD